MILVHDHSLRLVALYDQSDAAPYVSDRAPAADDSWLDQRSGHVSRILATVMATGKPSGLEYDLSPEKTVSRRRAVTVPIRNAADEITHFVTIEDDAAARRRRQALLEEAERAAQAAARAKTDFLSMMSYELRTPLHSILGMLHLLKGKCQDQESQDYLQIAENEGWSLLRVFSTMLALSSGPEAAEPTARPLRLDKLLADVLSLLEMEAARGKVTLSCRLADDCPAAIVGDESRLRHIIYNAVANSLKFTREGSISVRCSMAQTDQGAQLTLTVVDTGLGLSPEALAAVLDPPAPENPSPAVQGLSLVRKYAEELRGRLEVVSQIGQGCRVSVRMPVQVPPPREQSRPASAWLAGSGLANL